MGRYARALAARLKDKRPKVRWPKNPDGTRFDGAVLFCPRCAKEVLRVAKGYEADIGQQRLAVELHRSRCSRAS